jgi:hypothetical protein
MNDLREEARKILTSRHTIMSRGVAKDIEREVNQIHLTKIDDTKDMQGCFYSENKNEVMKELGVLLGYVRSRNYKSSRSCF